MPPLGLVGDGMPPLGLVGDGVPPSGLVGDGVPPLGLEGSQLTVSNRKSMIHIYRGMYRLTPFSCWSRCLEVVGGGLFEEVLVEDSTVNVELWG